MPLYTLTRRPGNADERAHVAIGSHPDAAFTTPLCETAWQQELPTRQYETVEGVLVAVNTLRVQGIPTCAYCEGAVRVASSEGLACLACRDTGEMSDHRGDRPCTECDLGSPAVRA